MAEVKSKAKPKKKVWICQALKTQKCCFETGDGRRTEYDFHVEGSKAENGKKYSGEYKLTNEEHVEKLTRRETAIISVRNITEV